MNICLCDCHQSYCDCCVDAVKKGDIVWDRSLFWTFQIFILLWGFGLGWVVFSG